MISRRNLFATAALAPLLPPIVAKAAEEVKPPTPAELVAEPVLADCGISPDGKTVAALRFKTKDKKRTPYVTFAPLEDLEKTKSIDVPEGSAGLRWVSNDRVAVTGKGPTFTNSFSNIYMWASTNQLTFVERESGKVIPTVNIFDKKSLRFARIAQLSTDDPDNLLVEALEMFSSQTNLCKVNVKTGDVAIVENGIHSTTGWIVQGGKPVLRMDESNGGRVMNIMAQAPGETTWKLVRRLPASSLATPEFEILGAADEPGVVFVSARAEGDDVKALHRLDLKALSYSSPASRRSDRDLTGLCRDKYGRYLGAMYVEDRLAYDLQDKALAAHVQELNDAFKGENNVRIYDISADRNVVIAQVFGPRQPGQFIVFDREKGAFGTLGETQPWLTPERLAPMRAVDIQSRDRSKFRAYLTVPLSPRPWPLVVLPHGGPEVRDAYEYDLVAQALAAQGWLVLQPNFRGSGGYGAKFAKAGRGCWNGRVMEDIEDATDQVIATGLVDKKRVAIMGMSFGGYAALMQGVRRPDLYRAVVSASGVSDLAKMLDSERQAGVESISYKYWTEQMGDPKADAAAIAQGSPALRAAEFKAPVLLIHGTADNNVPVQQSQVMNSALKGARKPVEYIEMRGAGHGNWDRLRTEAFLLRSTSFIKEAFDKVA